MTIGVSRVTSMRKSLIRIRRRVRAARGRQLNKVFLLSSLNLFFLALILFGFHQNLPEGVGNLVPGRPRRPRRRRPPLTPCHRPLCLPPNLFSSASPKLANSENSGGSLELLSRFAAETFAGNNNNSATL